MRWQKLFKFKKYFSRLSSYNIIPYWDKLCDNNFQIAKKYIEYVESCLPTKFSIKNIIEIV